MADDGPSARPAITVITTDEQDFMVVDATRWARLAEAVIEAEGFEGPAEIGLGFVELEAMAGLHEQYLGGEGPTDVLSFPLDDATSQVPAGHLRLLGDVVVCPEVAAGQAEQAGHQVADELAVLVIHGVLHLLGFDHAEPDDEATMFTRQAELVRAHHQR